MQDHGIRELHACKCMRPAHAAWSPAGTRVWVRRGQRGEGKRRGKPRVRRVPERDGTGRVGSDRPLEEDAGKGEGRERDSFQSVSLRARKG